MATPYTEQLAKWVKEKKSTPRNKNLVAFLAVRADIKEALDAGYPVKTIWENMLELKRIEFGYDTFLNYVNRQIRKPQEKSAAPSEEAAHASQENLPKQSSTASNTSAQKTKPGTLPSFTFNPTPNVEELF